MTSLTHVWSPMAWSAADPGPALAARSSSLVEVERELEMERLMIILESDSWYPDNELALHGGTQG